MATVGVQTRVEGAVFLRQGTMLAHAQPPQWSMLWCDTELWKDYTGGTSLQVKSLVEAVQTGMGSPLADCCQSSLSFGY